MNFADLDQLPAALQAAITYQQVSKGQVLFHRNAESRAIYVVQSGQVRLLLYTKSGQSISHYTIRPGEICDEVSLFQNTYTCSAIAEEQTQVLTFPKSAVLSTLQQNSDFAIAFMMQLSHRLHTTKMLVELRSIRSAQERVLHYLHLLASPEKNTVTLDQPLKHMASELGISPEVLSRTLSKLANDGAIARKKRKIILLDSSA